MVEGDLQIALGAALHDQEMARAGVEALVKGIDEVRTLYVESHGYEAEEQINTAVSQTLTGTLEVAVGILSHDPALKLEGAANMEQGISDLKQLIDQAQQVEAQHRMQSEPEQMEQHHHMIPEQEQSQDQAQHQQEQTSLQELLQEAFDHVLHQEEEPSEEPHAEQEEAVSEGEYIDNQESFGVSM